MQVSMFVQVLDGNKFKWYEVPYTPSIDPENDPPLEPDGLMKRFWKKIRDAGFAIVTPGISFSTAAVMKVQEERPMGVRIFP